MAFIDVSPLAVAHHLALAGGNSFLQMMDRRKRRSMGAREATQMLVIDFFKTPLLMGYVDGSREQRMESDVLLVF